MLLTAMVRKRMERAKVLVDGYRRWSAGARTGKEGVGNQGVIDSLARMRPEAARPQGFHTGFFRFNDLDMRIYLIEWMMSYHFQCWLSVGKLLLQTSE
jgi:hypothetical protein